MRSPANRRIRSSSAERKKRVSPGSPWRPERPRSWLSMRRDSWRSVPRMKRPPASSTRWRSAAIASSIFGSSALNCSSYSSSPGRRPIFASSSARAVLGAAAELDVDAAAGHVGRDRDGARAPGLGDRLALALGVLGAGVEDLVLDAAPAQAIGEQLGDLDGDRPDEHRLAGSRCARRSRARRPTTCRPWSCRPDRCDRRGPSGGWSGSARPAACRSS